MIKTTTEYRIPEFGVYGYPELVIRSPLEVGGTKCIEIHTPAGQRIRLSIQETYQLSDLLCQLANELSAE